MQRRRRPIPAFVATLIVLGGCSDASTATALAPDAGVGIYVLEQVTGSGPETGSFLLSFDGTATRRVRYGGLDPETEYVAIGTFTLTTDSIHFALREDGGKSAYVWRVHGSRTGDSFIIRYPAPADGWVTESYRRR